MAIESTKIIEILDHGKTRETILERTTSRDIATIAYPKDLYGNITIDPLRVDRKRLTEVAAGGMTTANFPDALRIGLQVDLFSGYNEQPTVYERLVRMRPSNRHQEEYGDDEGMGLPPIVAEGQEYPRVVPTMGGGKIIRNFKRGQIIEVTDEMQKFDQVGKVRDVVQSTGRAFRLGRDVSTLNALTTTTNYNVLNNNDQAANNYQTLTFSPDALNKAIALMRTQRDKKSGQIIGASPTILLVAPLLERFALALLTSQQLQRAGGNTTNDVYGSGTINPFYGAINTVISHPQFGASYEWALIDPSRAVYFQEVEPIQIFIEAGNMSSESWITRDTIRFKTRDWYGVGMRDDRFAFYSDSTTAPLAN